jgi:hypothetical protein
MYCLLHQQLALDVVSLLLVEIVSARSRICGKCLFCEGSLHLVLPEVNTMRGRHKSAGIHLLVARADGRVVERGRLDRLLSGQIRSRTWVVLVDNLDILTVWNFGNEVACRPSSVELLGWYFANAFVMSRSWVFTRRQVVAAFDRGLEDLALLLADVKI